MPRITAQQAGDVRLTAFLDVIAWSEGTRQHPLTKNDGYDVIVTGLEGKEIFTDYTDHPFAHREPKIIRLVPRLLSSASGRYQIIRPSSELKRSYYMQAQRNLKAARTATLFTIETH